jgi:PAS domain S-box-containing protein
MSHALGSASPKLRSAAIALAFASLYFLTAILTDSLIGDAGVAVLWPASGVYLGVMLVSSHRKWPALVCAAGLGSLAFYLYGGSSFQVSLAFAIPSCAEGFLAALLVERIARKRFRLAAPHDLFALVVGGVVVANALIALSAGAVAAQTFHASFAESWLRWWSADALGMLAVAPILTAPMRPGLPRPARWWSPPRVVALGGLGASLVAMQLVSKGGVDQVYGVQAFLAVLLLGSLGLVLAATERARMRDELGGARERGARQLDEARRRSVQLSAELAARRAEVIQTGRGQERLSESLRDSERARSRAERELDDTRTALAAAKDELEELSRDLGLTVADRDRAQTELRESTRTVERLKAEADTATANLAHARQNGRELESELERSRAETRALDEELERTRMESRAFESELERAAAERGQAADELAQAASEGSRLEEALESERAEHARTAEELAAAASDRRHLEEALESARLEHARTDEELAAAVADRRRLDEALQRARLEHARTDEELSEALAERARLEEELRSGHADHGRTAEELSEALADKALLEEELSSGRAYHGRAAEELAEAMAGRQRVEEELRGARAEHVRMAQELEAAVTERQLVEEELAIVAGRVEGLEQELQRSRREHRDAELALEHARARFAERRERLERALHEATGNGARPAGERAAPELSSRYDDRGRCLSVSPAFAALLGYGPDELVGHPGAELLHPDDRPRLARARAARTQSTFQGRLRHKSGDYVAVQVSLDPVWNGDRRRVELRTTVRPLALAA